MLNPHSINVSLYFKSKNLMKSFVTSFQLFRHILFFFSLLFFVSSLLFSSNFFTLCFSVFSILVLLLSQIHKIHYFSTLERSKKKEHKRYFLLQQLDYIFSTQKRMYIFICLYINTSLNIIVF